jgi:hypothetical protein
MSLTLSTWPGHPAVVRVRRASTTLPASTCLMAITGVSVWLQLLENTVKHVSLPTAATPLIVVLSFALICRLLATRVVDVNR